MDLKDLKADPDGVIRPRTVEEIIAALGGATAVGRICGFEKNQAARGSDFRQRGSIPSRYWERIVAAAKEQRNIEITYETLVRVNAPEGAVA